MSRRTVPLGDVVQVIYTRMLAAYGDPELASLATSTLLQDWATAPATPRQGRGPAKDEAA